MDEIKTIKYFTVTEELSYTEFDNFNQAFTTNHKFIIRQKTGYNIHPANNGDTFKNFASTLEFLADNEHALLFIEEDNWKYAFRHFGMTSGYGYTHMWIEFTDKFGYSNSEEKFEISIDGFLKSYQLFSDLKRYDGYKYGKLAIDNLEMKQKLTQYEQRNTVLEQENSTLKNLLSSMS